MNYLQRILAKLMIELDSKITGKDLETAKHTYSMIPGKLSDFLFMGGSYYLSDGGYSRLWYLEDGGIVVTSESRKEIKEAFTKEKELVKEINQVIQEILDRGGF